LGDQIKKNKTGTACGTYGRQEGCIQCFGGKNGGDKKHKLGRPRDRWEDNIKIDLQEVGWEGTNWSDLARDKDRWHVLVNAVINVGVPQMWVVSQLAEDSSFFVRTLLHGVS
jgi:hypothetical protein